MNCWMSKSIGSATGASPLKRSTIDGFFDINHLAAIRVEFPEVFDAAHELVFKLLASGDVTGLRIDHIDGLWDPRDYWQRLQERYTRLRTLQRSEKHYTSWWKKSST